MTAVARRGFLRGLAALGLTLGSSSGVGCRRKTSDAEVVVYCSLAESFAEPVLHDFELDKGIKVRAVYDSPAGRSADFYASLAEDKTHADIFWSSDPVRPMHLIRKGLVAPYRSPSAESIPTDFKGADGSWTGFAARARVLLVNKSKLAGAALPRSIREFTKETFRGKVGIANPLFGSSAMHVAALSVAWGREETKKYLTQLRANQIRIGTSNEDIQRLVETGELTVGLVDTDDAHEAMQSGTPVEVVYPDQEDLGTLVLPNSVVQMNHGAHGDAARKLIDYLTSLEVEAHLVDTAANIPLRPGIVAPPSVRPVSSLRSMRVDYAMVAEEMDKIEPWLKDWVDSKT